METDMTYEGLILLFLLGLHFFYMKKEIRLSEERILKALEK